MQKKYIFHIHTEFSWDCDMRLDKLFKKLIDQRINGVAITDHNEIEGALKFKEKYGNKIDVIVGEEIMTNKGEIIGLFLNHRIAPGLSPRETIELIKNQGGIVYIPHPIDKKRNKSCLDLDEIENNLDFIDIIEDFNGRIVNDEDLVNITKFCNGLNKITSCGSDAHTYSELKYNHIQIDTTEHLNSHNIIPKLKNAKYLNLKTNKVVHIYTKYSKLKTLIKRKDYHEIFRIIRKKYNRFVS
ncbi:PHP domain-containing protein [Rossellomorea aquimaris]|uniref:PHP domain-containing protein n=1 Tax=Rossellomorea aquimaris TaxID=189382 RepID=UPI000698ED9A|nr:PHP domain-containing protein [Rossellomorea aquimaris]